ncbi:MAG: immunoglobulin domain-containing protein, partial [Ignavibacteriae bacterium]|nr:immunoglobulin domain-containing protein [Ignavibacteriota bacterium]
MKGYLTVSRHLIAVLIASVVTPATSLSQSLISNPGFENGTSSWEFYTNGGGTFTTEIQSDNRVGKVSISKAGSNTQLYQTGIVLEAGKRYRLTFRAYSNTGHDVLLYIHKHGPPYSSYGLDGATADLTTAWASHSFEFTASGFTGIRSDGRFRIWLASTAVKNDMFYFDDFVLTSATATAPTITTQPTSISVAEGQTASFTVAASGTAPLSYQWQKNGASISGATVSTHATSPTTLADSGSTFRCVVSNSAGTITSAAAILSVTGRAPIILVQPTDQTTNEGASATFTISASGTPPLLFQWQKNDAPITGAADSVYHTPPASLADSGAAFACILSNSAGTITSTTARLHVRGNPPTITTQPLSQIIHVSSPVHFAVTAEGSGLLSFQWQRDGMNIPGATSSSFDLLAATLADSGAQFRCIAANSFGSDTSESAILRALEPLIILLQPHDTVATAGDSVTFSVGVQGSGPLAFRWEKNNQPISGATFDSLTLQAITLADDNAAFRCIITNPIDTIVSRSALLRLASPPHIVAHPENITTAVGRSATFSIIAAGSRPFSYQWVKNDTLLSSQTDSILFLQTVSREDSGATFRCIVRNSVGADTSDAGLLRVLTPALILSQPADQSVHEGDTAAFHAEANGSEPVLYQWQKDGVTIAGATEDSLLVYGTLSADGSRYRCIASNAVGSDTSRSALLAVLPIPPRITLHPANQNVLEGGTARFSVSASGTPPLQYQWLKNDSVLIGSQDSFLVVTNAALSDSGSTYRCVVSNASSSDTSAAAILSVRGIPPTILVHPLDQTVIEDSAATFMVTATGSLPLAYQWQRNGVDIVGAIDSLLRLNAVSNTDSGSVFRCLVRNRFGADTSGAARLTVLNPPIILEHPISQTSALGGAVTFRVRASGSEPLGYQWQRNNQTIMGAVDSVLTLPSVSADDDSASFRCIVSNAIGTATSSSALLRVNTPVLIIAQPQDQTLAVGQSVTFTVAAQGTLPFVYVWERNGSPIPGASDSFYRIASVSMTDSGATFRCLVRNSVGADTSEEAHLNVLVPPQITSQPASHHAQEGQSATFSVSASGSAPLLYQWQKNEANLTNADSSTLNIAVTALADSGSRYRCIVANPVGRDTSNIAILHVTGIAPSIVSHPEHRTVQEGDSASFGVAASGTLPLTYSWMKNGVALPGLNDSVIVLQQAALSDSGSSMRCIVSNPYGRDTSDVAVLTVLPAPPRILVQPTTQTAAEGDTARFSIQVIGSSPFAYQWKRNGANIDGAIAPTLLLYVQRSDSGSVFSCTVSNRAGVVQSDPALLHVLPRKPLITMHPMNVMAREGDTVNFSVRATGSEPLEYVWQKNGANILGANDTLLFVRGIALSDNGSLFRCIVRNSAGADTSAAAMLTVQGIAPLISIHPSDQSVAEGERATFTVTAVGSSPLAYRWQKDQTNIIGATDTVYMIQASSLADSGSAYRCLVTNAFGTDTSRSARLIVHGNPPTITVQPTSIVVADGDSATFSVRATGSGVVQFTWLKNGAPISGATDSAYRILSATCGDSGSVFRCVVANTYGIIVSDSATLSVIPRPPSITSQPASVTVFETQTAIFTIAATGTLPLHFQWRKDSTDIAGATSQSYTTPTVSRNDSGKVFRCVVSNIAGSVTSTPAILSVVAATPVIVIEPRDTSVIEEQTANFSVVAAGSGPFSYQWQRDRATITGATDSTYVLSVTSMLDNQVKFRCLVANASGADTSREATLTVVGRPPTIVLHPQSRTVNDGQPAVFTVSAFGTRPFSYQWQRNELIISQATDSLYLIASATMADSGAMFRCVVTNVAGTVMSDSAILSVNANPPSIAQQPTDQIVNEGGSAAFTVTATGTRPISYQWVKNGTAISGRTDSAYHMSATSLADSGAAFYCIASNSAGSDTSRVVRLHVRGVAPTITVEPRNQVVRLGSPAAFRIEATGSGVITYQWKRNGLDITGATSSTFTIASVAMGDSGVSFTCIASSPYGRDTSSAAVLKVLPLVKIMLVGDSITEWGCWRRLLWLRLRQNGFTNINYVGSMTTGGCGLDFDPDHEGHGGWTADGTVREGHFRSWMNAQHPDVMVYLMGTNDVGWVGANPTGPIFYAYPQTIAQAREVNPNIKILFALLTPRTQGGSIPAQNVVTLNAAIPGLIASLNTTQSPITLIDQFNGFNPATDTDDGLHPNASGNQKISDKWYPGLAAVLAISDTGAPLIVSHPVEQTILDGDSATFTLSAIGSIPLTYQWQKNGINVPGAIISSYTTPSMSVSDSGSSFRCIVTNSCGTTISNSVVLHVRRFPPSITQQPSNKTVQVGQLAVFAVSATGSQPLSYQWKRNGSAITGATVSSYT